MRALILLLLCAGCFPYREVYRPALDGVVVDAAGSPVSNIRVEACSATHWDPRCRYHANATTSADGRFHFSNQTEWDWCCFGEAPLPHTTLAACGSDGKIVMSEVSASQPPRLVLGQGGAVAEWAKQACGVTSSR
jgi:hypothetical protein